jgi:hypothetical protein
MTTEEEMRRLVSAPGVELFEREGDAWVVVSNESVRDFYSPRDALAVVDASLPEYPAIEVDYHVAVDELQDWADEDRGLLPRASNGWLFIEVGWAPVETAEDPTAASTLVDTFGDHGAAVYLHHWGNKYKAYLSGLEGQDSEWMSMDATTLEEACTEALRLLDGLLDVEGLNFPRFMGLDNLPESERYAVPDGVTLVERRTSFWNYGEEYICKLEVYARELDGAEQWLVADSDTGQVIGEYDSLEALDDELVYDEYEKLTYEVEEVEDDE